MNAADLVLRVPRRWLTARWWAYELVSVLAWAPLIGLARWAGMDWWPHQLLLVFAVVLYKHVTTVTSAQQDAMRTPQGDKGDG